MKKVVTILLLTYAMARCAAGFEGAERLQFADGLYARGMYESAVREYTAFLDGNPAGAETDRILFRRGECYRHIGDRMAADRDFRRVFAEFPASEYRFRAGYRRADLFMQAGQFAAAIDLYQAVLDAGAPAEIASASLYFMAEAQLRAGDNSKAAALFDRLIAEFGGSEFESYASIKRATMKVAEGGDVEEALGLLRRAAEKPANDRIGAEALFQIAEIHFGLDAYEAGAEVYAQLVARYPADRRVADARSKAAWAAHHAGRYAEALRYTRDAAAASHAEATPLKPEWLYLEANCLRQLVRVDDAIRAYETLLTSHPDSSYTAAARYELALTFFKSGRFEETVAAASLVKDAGDIERDAYWLLAESYAALGRTDDAVQYYRLIARKFPKSSIAADASYRLAHHLQERGELLEASRLFGRVSIDFPDNPLAPRALFASAFCLQRAGQFEDAARDWNAVVERFPKDALAEESLYQKGLCDVRLKRYEEASSTFARLLQAYPTGRFAADGHYWRGVLFGEADKLEDAESQLREALKRGPRPELHREVEFGLGLVLQRRGKTDEASQLLLPLLRTPVREKFTPPLLEWLAQYRLEQGDAQGALGSAELLAGHPDSASWRQTGWALTGRAHLARDERDDAADAFGKALAEPAQTAYAAEAALRLAEMAAAAGRHEEALGLFEQAATKSASDALLGVRAHAYAGMGKSAWTLGRAADAARYLMSVAILYDDAKLVPECLLLASRAFEKAGRPDEARQAAAELIERYPDSDEASQARGGGGEAQQGGGGAP